MFCSYYLKKGLWRLWDYGIIDNYSDFFRRELVKVILTILKRNVSALKLQINVNAHAQIYFEGKLLVISPNRNPPFTHWITFSQTNFLRK